MLVPELRGHEKQQVHSAAHRCVWSVHYGHMDKELIGRQQYHGIAIYQSCRRSLYCMEDQGKI